MVVAWLSGWVPAARMPATMVSTSECVSLMVKVLPSVGYAMGIRGSKMCCITSLAALATTYVALTIKVTAKTAG